MSALALSVAYFLAFALVGFGVIAAVQRSNEPVDLRIALSAPALGLALLVLAAATLSRCGLPVLSFGPALAGSAAVLSAVLLAVRRPPLPWRAIGIFSPILVLALYLSANPLISLGHDWIGFANDDGANYALAATRLLHNGLYARPDLTALLAERDQSLHFYFFQVVRRERLGADLVLALAAACTKLQPVVVLMPLMVALELVLIAASGALLAGLGLPAAALTGLAMAVAAPNTYSTLAQLAAQAVGMPLFAGAAVLLFDDRLYRAGALRAVLPQALLAALLLCGLGIAYPELGGFIVVPLAAYLALGLARREIPLGGTATALVACGVLALAGTNVGVLWIATELFSRTAAMHDASLALFDFSLLPGAYAMLWGIVPIFYVAEPFMSASIVGGAAVTVAVAAYAIVAGLRREPVALIVLTFLGVGAMLFFRGVDFDVFKIGLYVQPVLWALAALAVYRAARRARALPSRVVAVATGGLFAALLALNVPTQRIYVYSSLNNVSDRGIVDGTPPALISQLARLETLTGRPNAISDATNPTAFKYEAMFARGKSFDVPGWDMFHAFDAGSVSGLPDWIRAYADAYDRLHPPRTFDLHPATRGEPAVLRFAGDDVLRGVPPGRIDVWESAPSMEVLNRFDRDATDARLTVVPLENVRDRLVTVQTDRSQMAPWEEGRVANSIPLPDPGGPSTLQGFGRYELFEILNPSRRVRFVLSLTKALDDPDDQSIPPAAVIGDRRYRFAAVGAGDARLVSPPVSPQIVAGRAYVALDMGRPPTQRHLAKSALMSAYNRNWLLDGRFTDGDARDMSVVDTAAFDRSALPSHVDDPSAIVYGGPVPFSGMYENGDVAGRAAFVLRATPLDRNVLADVQLAPGDTAGRVVVLVDGRPAIDAPAGAGTHLFWRAGGVTPGPHRIELRVTAPPVYEGIFRGRYADARIVALGFFDDATAARGTYDIYDPRRPVTLGAGWYGFERIAGAGSEDGGLRWVDNDAQIIVGPSRLPEVLRLSVEAGPGLGGRPLVLHLRAGRRAAEAEHFRYAGTATLALPAHAAPQLVTLHVDGGGVRIPHDPRVLNFRVRKLWLDEHGGGP